MPYKDRQKNSEYMRHYRKKQKQIEITKRNYANVIREFKEKATLPSHVFEFRKVLKQMLLEHFHKRFIVVRKKTKLIYLSHNQ